MMQLFITDRPKMEEEVTVKPRDTEGVNMLGFCEICWTYDSLANLQLFHPRGNKGEHEPAHPVCVLNLTKSGEYMLCTC